MPISVVFAGTPSFAVPSLLALAHDPAFHITHVITQPDKPVGRKRIITPSPVKRAAQELKIPVWQPVNINKEWNETAAWERPDFVVVVAYGQLLSSEVLAFPTIAPVNLHASLLPRWRGASPIHHAILAGDTETGVTVQRMAQQLDTGPVLAQQRVAIGAQETFPELYENLAHMGATLLTETLKSPLSEVVQDESQATLCKKLSRDSGNADTAHMTAQEIDRMVRALNPWPGVRCAVFGETVKLLTTSVHPDPEALEVPCKASVLYVRTLQPEGRTSMNAKDWVRGKR